jgi:hypothetical protein
MTKFGRSGTTGPSDFLFQNTWFWQVQKKVKQELNLKISRSKVF